MDYTVWNSPGHNTGVGSHSLLQGIFPTEGSNPGLPHCRWILYQLSHKGSPYNLKFIPFGHPSPIFFHSPSLTTPSLNLQAQFWRVRRVFVLNRHISEIRWYLSLILLSIMPSRLMILWRTGFPFFFFLSWMTGFFLSWWFQCVYMYIFSIHSSIDGHVGCFCILAIASVEHGGADNLFQSVFSFSSNN